MARPFATPEQREEIRRKIQDAAALIFRRDGIAAISARSIAQQAGVSVGAIYAHFGDLPSLMQTLWSGHVERQNARFRDLAQQHPDPIARLRALLEAYVGFGLENALLYRNAFLFVRPESHARPDPEPLDMLDFPALIIAALKEGQDARRIVEGDPALMAQILWSGLHGCLALPVNLDRVALAPAKDLAPAMVDALLRSVVR